MYLITVKVTMVTSFSNQFCAMFAVQYYCKQNKLFFSFLDALRTELRLKDLKLFNENTNNHCFRTKYNHFFNVMINLEIIVYMYMDVVFATRKVNVFNTTFETSIRFTIRAYGCCFIYFYQIKSI